jgi:hypothetical protein
VPEHQLDHSGIDTVFKQPCRLSVPKTVGRRRTDTGRLGGGREATIECAAADRVGGGARGKQPARVLVGHDAKQSVFAFDGTDFKVCGLADAQTAGVQDGKAGSVDRVGYAAKQPADLGVGQRVGQPLLPRQADLFLRTAPNCG